MLKKYAHICVLHTQIGFKIGARLILSVFLVPITNNLPAILDQDTTPKLS